MKIRGNLAELLRRLAARLEENPPTRLVLAEEEPTTGLYRLTEIIDDDEDVE